MDPFGYVKSVWQRRHAKPKALPHAKPKPLPQWMRVRDRLLNILVWSVPFCVLVAGVYGAAASWETGARFVVWAIGLLGAGFFIGFLFGLPNTGQLDLQPPSDAPPSADQSKATPGSAPAVSPQRLGTGSRDDAMLAIADWLTKIIVGLGLVNLHEAPRLLDRLAAAVAGRSLEAQRGPILPWPFSRLQELPVRDDHSFALAMIVLFPILGLMLGYLTTRFFLQTALLRGDKEAQSEGARPLASYREIEREFLEQEQSAQAAAAGRTLPLSGNDPDEQTTTAISLLNQEYCSVNAADWRERTELKTKLGRKMYDLAIRKQVPKAWLANQPGDGYIYILATAALANPAQEDAEGLLEVGPRARMKHLKYRVAQAMLKLLQTNQVANSQVPLVQSLLKSYLLEADASLTNMLTMVLNQISNGGE